MEFVGVMAKLTSDSPRTCSFLTYAVHRIDNLICCVVVGRASG